jgi:hypothetical protein
LEADVTVAALQTQTDEYRTLLRLALASHPGPLPPRLRNWWEDEQVIIQKEADERALRLEQRRQNLSSRIATLQAELDALA